MKGKQKITRSYFTSFGVGGLLVLSMSSVVMSSSSCFQLDGTGVCGPTFKNVWIQSSDPSIFTNQIGFEAWFKSNILDVNLVSSKFTSTYGCPGNDLLDAVKQLQYQSSYWCGRFAYDSYLSCSSSTTFNAPMLCPSVCIAAKNSVASMFNTASICTPGVSIDSRNAFISTFNTACSNFSIALKNTGNTSCIIGVSDDINLCGT